MLHQRMLRDHTMFLQAMRLLYDPVRRPRAPHLPAHARLLGFQLQK
jgi:hypothetical protein